MKRVLVLLLAIILLTLTGIYLFIPGKVFISVNEKINCTSTGAMRTLEEKKKWADWWPGKTINNPAGTFNHATIDYIPGYAEYNFIQISIRNNNNSINSTLSVLPARNDSAELNWQCSIQTSSNPLKRLQQYLETRKILASMNDVFSSLRSFLEKPENVYGMVVKETKVTDSLLASTKSVFAAYPSTADIYKMISLLNGYINSQNAKQTGPPMLYVQQINNNFETMVALPVDKEVKNNNNITFKRMLGKGNILYGEIEGGFHRIRQGLLELENYRADYRRISPAIPFESLITNRLQQSDTTKWITRIYYPVF